ncbi:unnamed protein product [Ectocarpus sp. 12 AP-2014]
MKDIWIELHVSFPTPKRQDIHFKTHHVADRDNLQDFAPCEQKVPRKAGFVGHVAVQTFFLGRGIVGGKGNFATMQSTSALIRRCSLSEPMVVMALRCSSNRSTCGRVISPTQKK